MLSCRTWPLLSLHEGLEFEQDALWCLSGRRETHRRGCHMVFARAGKGLKDDDYYYYYYDTETIRVEKSVVKMLPVRVAPSVVSEFGFLFVFGCSFQ